MPATYVALSNTSGWNWSLARMSGTGDFFSNCSSLDRETLMGFKSKYKQNKCRKISGVLCGNQTDDSPISLAALIMTCSGVGQYWNTAWLLSICPQASWTGNWFCWPLGISLAYRTQCKPLTQSNVRTPHIEHVHLQREELWCIFFGNIIRTSAEKMRCPLIKGWNGNQLCNQNASSIYSRIASEKHHLMNSRATTYNNKKFYSFALYYIVTF